MKTICLIQVQTSSNNESTKNTPQTTYLIVTTKDFKSTDIQKLSWALNEPLEQKDLPVSGNFIGPRKEMVTPWSTNATDILKAMGIDGVLRIEEFKNVSDSENEQSSYDPMLQAVYKSLDEKTLITDQQPAKDFYIDDIDDFNKKEGLALSDEEVAFLKNSEAEILSRKFTDSEIFGFGQINSEHCRHKIFNGDFIIDGKKKEKTLFGLIKETSKKSPKNIVSAYKDNVAFINGPKIKQFVAQKESQEGSYKFKQREIETVISLKAETHNAPTTVEPFYGASTGSGGEIRDRMAGGVGSIPLVGTAVYMTSYPRVSNHSAEQKIAPRNWKHQSPEQILIKASNGASDFGNKFGQPLIVGSLLTFEGDVSGEGNKEEVTAFDKTIMLAGGVGYAKKEDAQKKEAIPGDALVVIGGENYRIGMSGSSFSSAEGGELSKNIELNAVQRANPEMQRRAYNAIRTLIESENNPIKLIHDHGAGGHLNCFSELVDPLGGEIEIDKLLVGDPTLSPREILSNESQERMGLVVAKEAVDEIVKIAERERAPIAVVGKITGDKKITCRKDDQVKGGYSVDLPLEVLFGSAPKTELFDETKNFKNKEIYLNNTYSEINSAEELLETIKSVLTQETIACKDWLTNKVDRSVTGLIAMQQCCGPLQLPLNNLGATAISFDSVEGIATSIGHAPVAGLIDERAASRLSIAESLTNIIWAPLKENLSSVVLSANWMWPAKQSGENARLYNAVESYSQFAQELNIAVPTGKDSLSMTLKYNDGKSVKSPGTVITSAAAWCEDVTKCITPDLKPIQNSKLIYINLSGIAENKIGGSSFAQSLGLLGNETPDCKASSLANGFNLIQQLIREDKIISGHDISSGGLITTALEMAFTGDLGVTLNLKSINFNNTSDLINFLFCEKPSLIIQIKQEQASEILNTFKTKNIEAIEIGEINLSNKDFNLSSNTISFKSDIEALRKVWFKPSHLLDLKQTKKENAIERFETLGKSPIRYKIEKELLEKDYSKILFNISQNKKIPAGILRDKGTNGDRELAYAMHIAGFDVKDITVNDLIEGREDLTDLYFLGFPGGFSHSDVLGSAKGWAGSCKFNERAQQAISNYFARKDTLSIGVCNGCQFMVAMNLVYPEFKDTAPQMQHNSSGRFESCFVNVNVEETNSIFLKPLIGSKLGVWVAHGEGRFELTKEESSYDIPLKYSSSTYPANPNGSAYNAAAISSKDGRHLAIMPHVERSLFIHNWGYFPKHEITHKINSDKSDKRIFSPWIECFINARGEF